ncbi:hypothetical protein B4U79_18074 [Dinothrombium tinctorium]|uniref:Metalloendopeptidase n=1 Tax=Dinothrombium tinctorium TaxID=1965070 RepID=A0A3S3PEA9_9ACAR|nr:hypothetical protein B4U79_18076 [Dinothrombium tinctorium]RWS10622.1 hypothetical protein B4U79_18074 [Dinothrombium tinctorium]
MATISMCYSLSILLIMCDCQELNLDYIKTILDLGEVEFTDHHLERGYISYFGERILQYKRRPLKMENGRIVIEYYTQVGEYFYVHRRLLFLATTEISQYTCITYVPLNGIVKRDEFHLLFIEENKLCDAMHPTKYEKELLIYIDDCEKDIPTFIHEIMHTLNFDHENNRPDADQYVKINWESIPKKYVHGFRKWHFDDWETNTNSSYSKMFPYDFKSVMHYYSGLNKFIVKKNGESIEKNWELSNIDKDELNFFYNCERNKLKQN